MTTITVNIHGAADLLKVHPKTVLDLIGSGTLPAAKIGRSYVLMTKDVVNYIEAQLVKQMAARMGLARPITKGRKPVPSRAGLRSASTSGGSCAQSPS